MLRMRPRPQSGRLLPRASRRAVLFRGNRRELHVYVIQVSRRHVAGNVRSPPEISMLEALTASCELMLIEERVPSLIEAVLRVVSGSHPSSARTSARDERLVSEAFRYI